MKTLVIHPFDPTTQFLEPVYQHVHEKTIIRGGITREKLEELMSDHDRIMMMGHGTASGLLSVGQFPVAGMYIVDHRLLEVLRKKRNNVFIWCNADHFVEFYELDGFYTGMFISEVSEALLMGLTGIDQSLVDGSNNLFSLSAGKHINGMTPAGICKNVKRDYSLLVSSNPVASYNHKRLYHS
jgi:hypothetical protein